MVFNLNACFARSHFKFLFFPPSVILASELSELMIGRQPAVFNFNSTATEMHI